MLFRDRNTEGLAFRPRVKLSGSDLAFDGDAFRQVGVIDADCVVAERTGWTRLGDGRVSIGSLSGSVRVFDPQLLEPSIEGLLARIRASQKPRKNR
jgi:hypothetical protein